MQQKLKNVLKQIKGRLPTPLPQSESAVLEFCADVCALGGFPANDSMYQAVATQIMHAGQDATSVRKIAFVNAIRRAITNQASFNVLQDIKERHNAKIKEAQAQETAKAAQEASNA